METRADQTRALAYAVGVHLIAFSLLFVGLIWNESEDVKIAGAPMDAVLIDLSVTRALPPPAARPTPQPAPKPEPKPAPPPPPPVQQQAAPEPDPVTDQRPVLPSVPDENALNLERERERQRLQEEQERLRAEQQREIERMEQLERIRKEREQLTQQQKLEEERLKQLEAQRARDILTQTAAPAPATPEPAAAPPRGEDVAPNLRGEYYGLIRQLVTQNWRRPLNTPPGVRCVLRVRQIPGGDVIGASIGSPCIADPMIQQSIIEAVERASPLPYEGFESVFQSAIELEFQYDG
jgi:colicin import membrane protein